MTVNARWDIWSMCFYMILACIGSRSLYLVKKRERKSGIQQKLNNYNYIIWWGTWTVAATFRYISPYNKVGGADAYSYAISYEQLYGLGRFVLNRLRHFGVVWELMYKFFYLISEDYHFMFFILHGLTIFSFIYFLNTFTPTEAGHAAILPAFYLYLRGFNTYRTELAIAFIMFSVVFIWKKYYVRGILLAVISVLFHSASLLYCCFLPFYIFVKNKGLTLKQGVLFTSATMVSGYIVRWLLVSETIKISYYARYAEISMTSSFFENYWKIVFGELLLVCAIVILRKRITYFRTNLTEIDAKRFDFIWIMCIFDFILIPITYLIHLWRGYEYFYLARLVMWSCLIVVVKKMFHKDLRKIIIVGSWIVFGSWLVFCVWNNWENSGLMPYIFAPFHSI